MIYCEMKKCIYYVHKPKEGEACQNQCGNDEIEIGQHPDFDKPVCYSFELGLPTLKKEK